MTEEGGGAEVNLLISKTRTPSNSRQINSTDLFRDNRANLSMIEKCSLHSLKTKH